MNKITLSIIFIMVLNATLSAQIKQDIRLEWDIASTLPTEHGHEALGVAGPIVGVHQNKLIIAGGANFPKGFPWQGGQKEIYNVAYVFKKRGHKISIIDKPFQLPFNIAYAASCSTPDGIFFAGGENEHGISNKVALLQWVNNGSTITFKNLPDLPVPITNAAATVIGSTVYITGGETKTAVSNQLICLDLKNIESGWQHLPDMPKPISHMVLTVLKNKKHTSIQVVGGRKKQASGISELYNTNYQYDVDSKTWNENAPLPYALSAGTGFAQAPNKIIILGGDKAETFHQVEILLAAIKDELNPIKKDSLIQQKNELLSSHPGFSKEVLQYSAATNKWNVIGTIPFPVPVTTSLVKWGACYIIPSGEIKAGVRSPNILSVMVKPNKK